MRSIATITEQISEIEAELNAIKTIKNKDPVKKAQIKDWIKTLNKEKKKFLSNEKKQNKALENMHDFFDENKQLKIELKNIKKQNKETVQKIKQLQPAQLIKFKKERNDVIKQLKTQKQRLQQNVKQHQLYKLQQEAKERKKEEKVQLMKIKEQQNKNNSVALIQKWYKASTLQKKRYSIKIIMFQCYGLKDHDLLSKTNHKELLTALHKKIRNWR